jgi:hypothetical protein
MSEQPTARAITEYDRARYNVLLPTPTLAAQIDRWHALRVSEVAISADPNSGDVFRVGGRTERGKGWVDIFALAKPALMRIASTAGIVWNWRESGPMRIDRDYVLYKAVGAVRLPDGSWQPIMATKEIDLEVIAEELEEQWTEKAEALVTKGGLGRDEQAHYKHEWRKVESTDRDQTETRSVCFLLPEDAERYVEDHVRAALIQWRKNKVQRAETGAMLRVIRAALGLKAGYTADELKRPFVVPRIDFVPDYDDPEVRRALMARSGAVVTEAFGQPAGPPAAAALPSGASAPAAPVEERPPIVAGEEETEEPPAAGDTPSGIDPSTGEIIESVGSAETTPVATPGLVPDVATCETCGQPVSESIRDYSRKAFGGKVLCFRHQPRRTRPARAVRGHGR